MKRLVICGILALVLLFVLIPAISAEEIDNDKVSTTLVFKGDFVKPQKGQVHFASQFNGYWHYK